MVARKRKDLSAALARAKESQSFEPGAPASGEVAVAEPPKAEPKAPAMPPATKAEPDGQGRGRSASRDGKKAVITYLPPDVHMNLKVLAARQDTTIQELSEQAYDLLFQKYND